MYQNILEDERRNGVGSSPLANGTLQIDESKLPRPLVYQISMNRVATPALERSVPAVKGDAARALFMVKCQEIGWAVIDSGIDGAHPAFREPDNPSKCRIVRSFDFTRIREIVSLDNLRPSGPRRRRFEERVDKLRQQRKITFEEAAQKLQELAEDASNERPINWDLVEPFIQIPPTLEPYSGHGTHVAGIIGASKTHMQKESDLAGFNLADGLCPDIKLYDFRVLARTHEDTEFAIIAALQYIRYLNERHNFLVIHGANLSLSIRHDVRNYACGRTPICQECERLVESGVVVVAAAGNRGYHNFDTAQGGYEGYAAFSITDPGNADSVITVGATHRFWPHTYGVSFFSSRGPTGDGRLKPDLVAPGERIESVLPMSKEKWGQLDGTSMAAPHVSGAAAMLMARYSELVGQPRRIKRILCDTATDLERERTFQGHGMLDVLRAFQSI
jgi:subtilisin family serine protease